MPQRIRRESPQGPSNGRNEIGALLGILLPLFGGIVYVSLRGAYVKVYDRFGMTPEDVGINSYGVLTGAFRVFFLGNWRPFSSHTQTVITRILIYFTPLLLLLYLRALGRHRFTSRRWQILQRLSKRRVLQRLGRIPLLYILWLYLIIVAVGIWITFQFTLGADVDKAISSIGNGTPVRPGDFSFLQVQAYPANVQPADGRKPPAALPQGQMLLYLGHADKHIVLYDPCAHMTWRIADDVALTIAGSDRRTISCCVGATPSTSAQDTSASTISQGSPRYGRVTPRRTS